MKHAAVCISAICILLQGAFAIGDQHGVFRSQSTQGAPWMGTATIEEEEYRITVYPDYLDIELDWVFRASGTAPDTFRNSLEIVGNLNLAHKSVVVGMITWWKGDILKGKLKTTTMARADYEEVVQRDADAPPPPRDPVLLEYGWGEDNYNISIFPVTFNETRKVRIRYLIPAFTIAGVNKILYPHAFSPSAKVSVKAGAGVTSYKVETAKDHHLYDNAEFRALSATDFSFQAYGSRSGGERISHIVPVLAEQQSGSRFYLANVSAGNLSGQMVHVAAMGAPDVIAKTGLAEDYVILWRWNHPELLRLYARQIVEQSKLLKVLLDKLEGSNKRAALIIDKEGGERITFSLDSKGGTAYNRMIAYLEELAATPVVDPPVSTISPTYNLTVDATKAVSDFEAAIAAAIALFDKNSDALRHLLILTAGPQLIRTYVAQHDLTIDSTIRVSSLADFAAGKSLGIDIPESASRIYWPGTNPAGIFTKQSLDLTIDAVVRNGRDTCVIKVLTPPQTSSMYSGSQSEAQKHIFSDLPLQMKISWRVIGKSKVLAQFEETPQMVTLQDNMQYARLLGASRHLTPMAAQMPRSMAATLGFIDSSYSLVALEEDKLPPAVAAQYEESGVPLLGQGDIHAAESDLALIATKDWLLDNAPQPLWTYTGSSGGWGGGWWGDPRIRFMLADMAGAPEVKQVANDAAFMAMPVADAINSSESASYEDYTGALATRQFKSSVGTRSLAPVSVTGGFLNIDLSIYSVSERSRMRVALYDLTGRLVYEWSPGELATGGNLKLPLADTRIPRGTCLVRITSSSLNLTERVVIR